MPKIIPKNTSLLVVAITGSFAGGKSSFAGEFERLGAIVVDADQLSREVTTPGSIGLNALVGAFGPTIITSDGALARATLAALIFSNAEQRLRAQEILHPLIRTAWLTRLDGIRATVRTNPTIVAYGVPLLFESGLPYPEILISIAVVAPNEIAVSRAVSRDGISTEAAWSRINSQLPFDEKCRRADICVKNTGSIYELKQRASKIFSELRGKLESPNENVSTK